MVVDVDLNGEESNRIVIGLAWAGLRSRAAMVAGHSRIPHPRPHAHTRFCSLSHSLASFLFVRAIKMYMATYTAQFDFKFFFV